MTSSPSAGGRGEGVVVVPVNDELLPRCETLHRQLRPQLPAAYAARMREIMAHGAEMAVALVDGAPAGITVFRVLEKTLSRRELYCDDLVTDDRLRSTGVGAAMMQYMERVAAERGCDVLTLDSGTQRQQAHKFYFREGMVVTSFHFAKPLAPRG